MSGAGALSALAGATREKAVHTEQGPTDSVCTGLYLRARQLAYPRWGQCGGYWSRCSGSAGAPAELTDAGLLRASAHASAPLMRLWHVVTDHKAVGLWTWLECAWCDLRHNPGIVWPRSPRRLSLALSAFVTARLLFGGGAPAKSAQAPTLPYVPVM